MPLGLMETPGAQSQRIIGMSRERSPCGILTHPVQEHTRECLVVEVRQRRSRNSWLVSTRSTARVSTSQLHGHELPRKSIEDHHPVAACVHGIENGVAEHGHTEHSEHGTEIFTPKDLALPADDLDRLQRLWVIPNEERVKGAMPS